MLLRPIWIYLEINELPRRPGRGAFWYKQRGIQSDLNLYNEPKVGEENPSGWVLIFQIKRVPLFDSFINKKYTPFRQNQEVAISSLSLSK